MTDQFVEQADPEEVFMLLADGTRLGIVRALGERDTRTMTFSELREAVGVQDSGRFNYHLDKLVGQFVTKSDDGYRLTQAGKHVNGGIMSGMYTVREAIDPIALDHACRTCGGSLTLAYEGETARITCEDCSSGWEAPVSPAALAGYDRDEIPRIVSQFLRTSFRQVATGFCLYCEGRMEPTVGPVDAMDVGPSPEDRDSDRPPDHPVVQFDCRRCGHVAGIALDHGLLIAEPAVERFYHEHGIDLRDYPIWGIPRLDPERATIERRNPVRASVRFRVEGSTLTVTVDERFNVLGTEA